MGSNGFIRNVSLLLYSRTRRFRLGIGLIIALAAVAAAQQRAWPDRGTFDHVLPVKDLDRALRRRKCSATHLLVSKLDDPRCLPTFFVLGAQKSGTSTLAYWMAQHPQIWHPVSKELAFFSHGPSLLHEDASASTAQCPPRPKAFKLYLTSFPRILPEQGNHPYGKITGEWSPMYLPCRCCAASMHSLLPHARLIAVLRHPVERAFSRYTEQLTHRVRMFEQEVIGGFLDPFATGPWRTWPSFVNHSLHALRACSPHFQASLSFDSTSGLASYSSSSMSGTSSSSANSSSAENSHHHHEDAWHDCAFASTMGYSVLAYSDYFHQAWLKGYSSSSTERDGSPLLIVYTDELETSPLAVMRLLEDHLGLGAYQRYMQLNTSFNSRAGYGYFTAPNKAGWNFVAAPNLSSDLPASMRAALMEYYLPGMRGLKQLGDQGDIRPPPARWLKDFGLL